MLYWIFYPLREELSFLRIFSYVTFRSVGAALTALLLTYFLAPVIIRLLKRLQLGEKIREDGPISHQKKEGTPTMGGALFIVSTFISTLLWGYLENLYVIFTLIFFLLFGLLGFWDDYLKVVKKDKKGIRAKKKFFLQLLLAGGFSSLIYLFPYYPPGKESLPTELYLPFLKNPVLDMGIGSIPFWMLVLVATVNAVNLTDGLDGLAAGLSGIVLGVLGIIAYLTGVKLIATYLLIPYIPEGNEIVLFISALLGGIVGFLWYNAYPAEIFMGDTGSMALGSAIGMSAICIKREMLLLILGGIFVLEALSVILQVGYFRWRRKRIFKMAPLHHHFELLGWHENKVVVRFWIIQVALALLALFSLKVI